MTKRSLDDILADDDLISVPDETQPASSVDSRVRQEFEEILLFVDTNGRRPQLPDALRGISASTTERRLAIRLGKYLSKPELIASLKPFDRHGVLAPSKPTMEPGTVSPKSVDEILSLDDGILSSDHDDIFELRFVGGKRAEPDWIANRTPAPTSIASGRSSMHVQPSSPAGLERRFGSSMSRTSTPATGSSSMA